jgi:hypothetical protein
MPASALLFEAPLDDYQAGFCSLARVRFFLSSPCDHRHDALHRLKDGPGHRAVIRIASLYRVVAAKLSRRRQRQYTLPRFCWLLCGN